MHAKNSTFPALGTLRTIERFLRILPFGPVVFGLTPGAGALRIELLVAAASFEAVFAVVLWPVSRQQCQYEVGIGHLHASLRGSLNVRLHGIKTAQASHHDPAGVER